jgi:hypothetical protein
VTLLAEVFEMAAVLSVAPVGFAFVAWLCGREW